MESAAVWLESVFRLQASECNTVLLHCFLVGPHRALAGRWTGVSSADGRLWRKGVLGDHNACNRILERQP